MNKERFQLLIQCLISLESEEETMAFLEDLCTIKEMEDMQHRLEIAVGLMDGQTFTEVQHETGASSTTVSRVSRCLKYGDGYRRILDRLKK
ncbi:DNA-binding transcriptional regulator [Alkalibacter rhizosphaerae]|uniref:DNA-binding transcriptional regulator n=1 Tax=Alkalibacter rhizosphaerae TaxID=2815577 RepID=A0A974XH80_9FIRM|nr:YerC/YecD family TrpR-related protein [Alkalibacter rhizosphaerae]QSX08283.1 DNA-binding transcriptional regulator [Alkalibacter rhizosphaerae]